MGAEETREIKLRVSVIATVLWDVGDSRPSDAEWISKRLDIHLALGYSQTQSC